VIHIISPPKAGKGLLIKVMRDRTRELDEVDFKKLRTWVVYYQDGWAIVKFSAESREAFMDVLSSMKGTSTREGAFEFNIAGVSGTIRRAYAKFIPTIVRSSKHYHEDREGG